MREHKARAAKWLTDIQCEVEAIGYEPGRRTGTLYMAAGDCCDMSACIVLFEGIDPAVVKIVTMSGADPDTTYVKASSERLWVAIPRRD